MSACGHMPTIETEDYVGPDRRATDRRHECDDHIHRVVHERVGKCKDEVYKEIHGMRGDIGKLNDRLNILADDVHKLGLAVRDIANNSAEIARSLNAMTEVATAYKNVQGWWSVTNWIRHNIITVGVVLVILYYVIANGDAVQIVQGMLP